MAKKKAKQKPKHRSRRAQPLSTGVSLSKTPDGKGWVLAHPRAARERAEDLEEVRLMIEAGEYEVAVDELRWLLSGCSDFIDAHLLLGELALEAGNDLPLARGHWGYAYELGLRAWRRAGEPTPVPYLQPANRGFLEAGRALTWCLEKLGQSVKANELVNTLLQLDPGDPLGVRELLDELRSGGLPVVSLPLPSPPSAKPTAEEPDAGP